MQVAKMFTSKQERKSNDAKIIDFNSIPFLVCAIKNSKMHEKYAQTELTIFKLCVSLF